MPATLYTTWKRENWDRNTPSNSTKAPGSKLKFGEERVHRKVFSQGVNHMNVVLARQNSRKDHEETLIQERCSRKAAWDLAKNIQKFKNSDKTKFCSPTEAWAMPATTSKSPEELEFVVDSEASMHMLCKKDVSSGELETLRRSRKPTTVVTAILRANKRGN